MSQETYTTFDDLHLPQFFKTHLSSKMDIFIPTQVQVSSFKPILSGHDVLMKSETGSGKTLAFLIPIILHLGLRQTRINRNEGTKCMLSLFLSASYSSHCLSFCFLCLHFISTNYRSNT